MDVMVRVLVPGLDAAGFVGAQGRAMLVAAAPAAAAAVHAYFVRVPATGEPAARPTAAAAEQRRGGCHGGAVAFPAEGRADGIPRTGIVVASAGRSKRPSLHVPAAGLAVNREGIGAAGVAAAAAAPRDVVGGVGAVRRPYESPKPIISWLCKKTRGLRTGVGVLVGAGAFGVARAHVDVAARADLAAGGAVRDELAVARAADKDAFRLATTHTNREKKRGASHQLALQPSSVAELVSPPR